jgi:MFS family permease
MSRDRPIIYLALGQTVVWAGLYYVFPALLVRWEQSLGWSKADLTAAITLAVFISALCSPFAGRLIDAGKGARMMAGCTILGGLCLFTLSFVTTLTQFYLVWGAIGMALAGCLYEPCFALITRARGGNAKQGIILVTLIAGFASSISFPTVHTLAEAFGWRIALRVLALVVVVVGTPLMWAGASLVEQAGKVNLSRRASHDIHRHAFLAAPVFWFLALGFALGGMLHGVTLHHLLPILFDRGIHIDVAIMAASFIGPMQVAGRLAMMAAEKHVSNHGIAITCFILMGSSILLLMGSGSTPALLVGFVILYGGSYGIVSIIRPVITREVLGEHNFGAKSGALAALYLTGTASAPFLGSIVWGIGGYNLVLPCLMGIAVIALLLYLTAHRLAVVT